MDGMALVTGLLVVHFIADFLLQSNWMALGKSKSWLPLLSHVGVYSICFVPFGLLFALLTFIFHLTTDYWTSRLTSRLWFLTFVRREPCNTEQWCHLDMDDSKRHWFFVAIGFDQLIHGVSLLWTAYWLHLL